MAELSVQELEQVYSYLAQQGVVTQPTTTDRTKREIVFAALNQIGRNPAQVFGFALDDFNFTRVQYHLGYNIATVPAGDFTRLQLACNSIPSQFFYDKIVQQIERCEDAERLSELATGRATSRQEIILGDVSRTISVQDKREVANIWRENYIFETDRLAQLLFVANYRNPMTNRFRFERSGASYVQALPGAPSMSRADRIYFATNWR
jgi:hypothetical protein